MYTEDARLRPTYILFQRMCVVSYLITSNYERDCILVLHHATHPREWYAKRQDNLPAMAVVNYMTDITRVRL